MSTSHPGPADCADFQIYYVTIMHVFAALPQFRLWTSHPGPASCADLQNYYVSNWRRCTFSLRRCWNWVRMAKLCPRARSGVCGQERTKVKGYEYPLATRPNFGRRSGASASRIVSYCFPWFIL